MGEEGLRARKRRETLERITDAAMRLFIARGYAQTRVEDIAEAAGISRRTFFHYFESKDDILLSLQSGMGPILAAALRATSPDLRPLDAIRAAMIAVSATFPQEDMLAIDRLMRASPAVQARKQASYVQQEQALFAVLRERWPAPEREAGLRLAAMLGVGAMRLALEALSREEGRRPLVTLLNEAFDALNELNRD